MRFYFNHFIFITMICSVISKKCNRGWLLPLMSSITSSSSLSTNATTSSSLSNNVTTSSSISSSTIPIDTLSIDDDFNKFQKVNDDVVFSGWRKIIRRKLQLPNGIIKDFDILSTATSIVVFTWDTKTKTTTLIQEYHPGIEKALYGTVAGMYEEGKHDDPLQCAMYELEEEAHLESKNWIPLLNDEQSTVSLDKYSDNKFYAYLAIDCKEVSNPRDIDPEEYITIKNSINYKKLMQLITSGKMNILSSYASLMAINKLKDLGMTLE